MAATGQTGDFDMALHLSFPDDPHAILDPAGICAGVVHCLVREGSANFFA
jgi:hypothetical protein